jgi:hypothetical protein
MLQAECIPVPIGLYTRELPSPLFEHLRALVGIERSTMPGEGLGF